jgi:hypothetical protein
MTFTKYKLSDKQIKQIARLCAQEQGSLAGAKAEASLMANQLETNDYRRRKYGTGATGLFNWIRNGGWFYRSAYYMDYGSASASIIAGVKDVLVEGHRTLPQYIDEHDCFSDISSISTGDKRTRSDYVRGKTIVKNRMGSTYTFYSFPDQESDPFGYTSEAYNYVKAHGGEVPDVEPEESRVTITAAMRLLSRGSSGTTVKIWQAIAGTDIDGDFGPKTENATIRWQLAHGLTADGIVGAATWKTALNE